MNIVVRTVSDQVLEVIRDRILSGELPADKPIRQNPLASSLGISKIPLREALARLEQDGLVSSQPNRGFVVRPLDPNEAQEVYALRLKIEPEATALASQLATEKEKDVARAAFVAVDSAGLTGDIHVTVLNRAFHMAMVRPSGQQVTSQLIERLHVLSERYVRLHLIPTGRPERAHNEHEQLLKTWLSGKPEEVEAVTAAHIAKTLNDLKQQLSETV